MHSERKEKWVMSACAECSVLYSDKWVRSADGSVVIFRAWTGSGFEISGWAGLG